MLERNTLSLLDALGLNNVIALLKEFDHLRDHLGRVLSVSIHGNDEVCARGVQPGGECRLMTKVTRKLKHNDPPILLCQGGKTFHGIILRAIIYIIKRELVWQRINDFTNTGISLFDNPRLVENRNNQV